MLNTYSSDDLILLYKIQMKRNHAAVTLCLATEIKLIDSYFF